MSNKVYEIITDRIIADLEKGKIPWKKPWNGAEGAPANFVSKKAYRGVNIFLLALNDYDSPFYVTFKQAKQLGGHVKKGERGHLVTFFKMLEREDKNGESYEIPMLRYYTVFNLQQCEGIDYPKPEKQIDFEPIDRAQAIVDNMPKRPEITHNENAAWYKPGTDTVNMPNPDYFDSPEAYHSTLFHELGHSTGHETRLDRHRHEDCSHMFGSASYSKEELVAEMTAAFLCGVCAIDTEDTRENTTAYINNWISKLKNDPKMVVWAASRAQAAADFILAGMEKEETSDPETTAQAA